jgi:hypothetical protein
MVMAGLALVTIAGCGLLDAPPAAPSPSPQPAPTMLPAPKPITSPQPGDEPSPVASPVSSAPPPVPTRIPPPNLNPGTAPAGDPSGRARVANTEGQGANMRAEPSPGGTLVRTILDGTELELFGAEREGGGRQWRNVRDPASGASGWIVTELLEVVSSEATAPAGEPKPVGEPKPGASAKPEAEAKPVGIPKPAASPQAGAPAGAAKPTTSIGDEDRAYLTVLQAQVDVLGKAIVSANEQIERAGGRPEMVSDATWRKDTEAAIDSLRSAAAKIREAKPGSATGEVHRFARNAADRAEEAAAGLANAVESKDARALVNTRTTLVRLLAELNNMNLSLLDLR